MKFAVKSDKGNIREINEDSYNIIAGYTDVPVSFIIADGMGGHNSGEIASKMAVDFISNHILRFAEKFAVEDGICAAIEEAMQKANKTVYGESMANEANYGMGTTLIVAVVTGKKLYIGHIGDSRVYMYRNNTLKLLTKDHTFIGELMRNGSLTEEEAAGHPNRNMLTRALGCEENVDIDIYKYDIRENDLILLCTDGLTNMLSEAEIGEIIKNTDDPEIICSKLIDGANTNGGEDNTTVIVFKN